MKLLINSKSTYLLSLFMWSLQVSAQIPATVQFDINAQEIIRENREHQQYMQHMLAEEAAEQMAEFGNRDPQGNYIRLNLNRCLKAQLPQGFCNLLTQPPWNQP